jgi:hypothetical protein
MFKIFQLGVSKFDFLSLYPFCTKNFNEIPILPLTSKLKLCHFENNIILELKIKLIFFVQNK